MSYESEMRDIIKELKENSWFIEQVPESFRTPQVWQIVLEDGFKNKRGSLLLYALEKMPRELVTKKLIDELIEQVKIERHNKVIRDKAKSFADRGGEKEGGISDNSLIMQSKKIPAQFWTAEITQFCFDVVRSNGNFIQHIPEERITQEMCEVAVNSKPAALEHVPNQYKTLAMCEAAAAHDLYNALPFIPANIASEKISALCLERLRQDGVVLRQGKSTGTIFNRIPKHLLTPSICVEAIKQDYFHNFSRDLDKIPEGLRTAEVYFEWVKKKPTAFGHFEQVPDTYKTQEMCELVMKESDYSYRCFSVVPDQYKTPEMCLAAVKAYAGNYNAVPQSMRTEELTMLAKGGGIITQAAPQVTKEQLTSMDAYNAALAARLVNLSPKAQEVMLNTMPEVQREQIRKAMAEAKK